VVTLGDQK